MSIPVHGIHGVLVRQI